MGLERAMYLLYTCTVVFLCYYFVRITLWYRKIRIVGDRLKKLPGSDGHWLLGHLGEYPGLNAAGLQYWLDTANRHGNRVYKFWFGPFRPNAVLVHPDTAKHILKTTEPKAMKDKGGYTVVVPWLGDGLILSHGDKWRRNRRLLTPAFHFDILKTYIPIYNNSIDILMDKWQKQLNASPTESIEVYSSVSMCTLDIILQCAFSYSDDVQRTGSCNVYVNTVLSLSDMIIQRVFNFLWYFDSIYYKTAHGKRFASSCAYVHKMAEDIIVQRRKALVDNAGSSEQRKFDFLDILLKARDEEGSGLTDVEIRQEVDTFLFAGCHDTTASAISWCLYHLAKHEDCQEKARREVDQLLRDRNPPTVTWDDLGELPFLTMCIRESLRCIPPVPLISRDVTVPVDIDGVTLLPGTIVDIPIYTLHHNPTVWGEDHLEFKPERFSVDKMRTMDPYAYVPFSAGPRNCIGQSFALHELKVFLARVLHRFVLKVDPSNPTELLPHIVMRSKSGIHLFFTAR